MQTNSETRTSKFAAICLASLDRTKQRSHDIVSEVERLSAEQVRHRPSEVEWSVLEVLDHLRRTESAIHRSCEENIRLRRHRVSAQERVKAKFFLLMLRLPVRVKVPSTVSFVLPSMPESLQKVLDAWKQEHLRFRDFLAKVTARDAGIGAVKHPAVGWLDLRGALLFLSVHLRHHYFQIDRLKLSMSKLR